MQREVNIAAQLLNQIFGQLIIKIVFGMGVGFLYVLIPFLIVNHFLYVDETLSAAILGVSIAFIAFKMFSSNNEMTTSKGPAPMATPKPTLPKKPKND